MAASDKIFRLLDLPEPARRQRQRLRGRHIVLPGLCAFPTNRSAKCCAACDLTIPQGSFTAHRGRERLRQKHHLPRILMGRNQGYHRQRDAGRRGAARHPKRTSLMRRTSPMSATRATCSRARCATICCMGKPGAADAELWAVLEQVNLAGFLRGEAGARHPAYGARRQPFRRPAPAPGARPGAAARQPGVHLRRGHHPTSTLRARTTSCAQIHALAETQDGAPDLAPSGERRRRRTTFMCWSDGRMVRAAARTRRCCKQGGAYAALWAAQQELGTLRKGGRHR